VYSALLFKSQSTIYLVKSFNSFHRM